MFTPISDGVTNVNATDVNSRFTEISTAISNLISGVTTFTSLKVSATGWTNANHTHQGATTGGQLEADLALKATGDPTTKYLRPNGSNGVEWVDLPTAVLTTKGDLLTRDGSALARLAVGSDLSVLVADSAQSTGIKWASVARIAVGTYTGNGVDNRWITGVGFTPKFVLVQRSSTSLQAYSLSSFPADNSGIFGAAGTTTANYIQAFNSDGFQVGTDNYVNGSTFTYYWLAIG